jgi:uncharacterized iron-regulated membrane protein
MFRKALFWTHLVAGITAAIVIVIMSVTGVALTYQRQMQYWADTRHYRVPLGDTTGNLPQLSVDALVARAESALSTAEPVRVTAITYRADPTLPVALAVGPATYYANPQTGALYGEPTGTAMRTFFSSMVNWHRWLAMAGDERPVGRAITGAANLLFLFIVLSGLYLWWPRSLSWAKWRNVLWFRRGLPGKARDFNWHNALGFWSAIPLALVVYSGVVISYPWASNGVYRLMGETPPVAPARSTAPPAFEAGDANLSDPGGSAVTLEEIRAVAASRDAAWNILSLRLPASVGAPVVATIDRGDGGQPHLRGTLTVNSSTGIVESWAPFSAQTPGRQLRSILRFAHTGEAGGMTGQTIAGLVSAFSVVMVYTGVALSWRRMLSWLRRRRGGRMDRPVDGISRAA